MKYGIKNLNIIPNKIEISEINNKILEYQKKCESYQLVHDYRTIHRLYVKDDRYKYDSDTNYSLDSDYTIGQSLNSNNIYKRGDIIHGSDISTNKFIIDFLPCGIINDYYSDTKVAINYTNGNYLFIFNHSAPALAVIDIRNNKIIYRFSLTHSNRGKGGYPSLTKIIYMDDTEIFIFNYTYLFGIKFNNSKYEFRNSVYLNHDKYDWVFKGENKELCALFKDGNNYILEKINKNNSKVIQRYDITEYIKIVNTGTPSHMNINDLYFRKYLNIFMVGDNSDKLIIVYHKTILFCEAIFNTNYHKFTINDNFANNRFMSDIIHYDNNTTYVIITNTANYEYNAKIIIFKLTKGGSITSRIIDGNSEAYMIPLYIKDNKLYIVKAESINSGNTKFGYYDLNESNSEFVFIDTLNNFKLARGYIERGVYKFTFPDYNFSYAIETEELYEYITHLNLRPIDDNTVVLHNDMYDVSRLFNSGDFVTID